MDYTSNLRQVQNSMSSLLNCYFNLFVSRSVVFIKCFIVFDVLFIYLAVLWSWI